MKYKVWVQHYGKQPSLLLQTDSELEALDFKRDQSEILKGYYKRTGTLNDGTFVVFGKYQGMDDIMKIRIWVQSVKA